MRAAVLLVLVAIVGSVAAALSPVLNAEFINFDDDQYVTDNLHVRQGFGMEGLRWAFTTRDAANWHPLTWLSHEVDVDLYGLNPRGHHLTSLLLHLANVALLFVVLARFTGRCWASAFAAALFGLHPLHVESVAWIAERKDLLSTFFALLALLAYRRYLRGPSTAGYLAVAGLFALGLMSKPMVVTLPLLLLLLDYWPLGRLPGGGNPRRPASAWSRPVIEKAPLLLLSAASAAVTLYAQQSGGAVQSFPLATRVLNALAGTVQYLEKTIWPEHLAIFYPHRGHDLPFWLGAGAGVFLVAASAAIAGARRRMPFLVTGWLWFLIALLPVAGLVQVGRQAIADRYTYVPLIGVFLMVSWGAPALLGGWLHRRVALAVAAALVLLPLGVRAHRQAEAWRDSLTLFTAALHHTEENWLAEYNVGLLLSRRGDNAGATEHLRNAIRIRPDYAEAHNNLGTLLAAERRFAEAEQHFRAALRGEPLMARPVIGRAQVNLGNVLYEQGKADEALALYREARSLNPLDAVPVFCQAFVEAGRGNLGVAEELYRETLRLQPAYEGAASNLASLLLRLNRPAEAVTALETFLAVNPGNARVHLAAAKILGSQGARERAVTHYREALRLDPANQEARLGVESGGSPPGGSKPSL